jgi:hypothetical protein
MSGRRRIPPYSTHQLRGRAAVLLIALAAIACASAHAVAATAVRLTADGASSVAPAISRGADGKSRVVWTDTRTGGTEIFFTMVDDWGNRLLPDVQVSHTPAVSSTVPRVGVDSQGYAYVCWLESKTVWLAKVDPAGNVLDSTAVSLGFNYLAEFPDISVAATGGLGVGFTSQSGVLDEDYMVLFDADLNKLCQRRMFTNLTWLDRHVTIECDDELYCTLYWQSSDLFAGENLSGGAMTPACGAFGAGNICAGNNYSTMTNHAAGLVVQRGNRIHVGNGAGCPAAFSELPGPSVTPSAWTLNSTRSLVAWDDRRSGTPDIYFAHYSNSTFTKIGVDSLLAGGTSSSSAPAVTSDLNGTGLVVWQDNRDGNNEIYFGRTPEPSGSFGAFTGTVYDAVTLQPIPFALVEIQGPERPLVAARHIVAGADGRYRAAGLPPGPHSLVASHGGRVSEPLDGEPLAAGQTRVLDLRISTGVVLTGTVRDVDSRRPVRGAQVALRSLTGPEFLRAMLTGPDGRYRFDLPAGEFAIEVRDTIPGDSTEYRSTANDYYRPESLPSLTVASDTRRDFDLASNTIVLVHGIRSSAEFWGRAAYVAVGDSLLRARLERAGFHTEAPTRDWRRSIPEQGAALARWFADQEFAGARVIAHSMGGLAARWAIEEMGPAGLGGAVPLLVTLGTPHHGSPTASDAHALLLAIGALPEALGIVSFTGGLSLFGWETLLREHWPFLIDLQPNNANLNLMNYGVRDAGDDPWRFTCTSDGGPAHPAEALAAATVYVAFAGESPSAKYAGLQPFLGTACANDGVVPVHSARLWNPAAINLRTRCLTDHGAYDDCGVRHSVAAGADPVPAATGHPDFANSGCLAVHLVNLLGGDVPVESCPGAATPAAASDSLYDALPEVSGVVGAVDSLSGAIAIASGQTLIVRAVWQRGGARLRLVGPGSTVVDSASCSGDPTRLFVSDPALHWQLIQVASPAPGAWSAVAVTDADSAQHVSLRAMVTGGVTLDPSVRAASGSPGQPVQLRGALHRDGAPLLGAAVDGQWSGPGGAAGTMVLHDDGLDGDDVPADGTYSSALVPPVSGTYVVSLRATGGAGPSYGERGAAATFRAAHAADLRLVEGDVTSAQTWTYPGDPLLLGVRLHNGGSANADSVWFVARDDSTGVVLAESLLAVPAGGERLVSVSFRSNRRGIHSLSLWAVPVGDPPDAQPADNGTTYGVEVVEFGAQPLVGVPVAPRAAPTGPRLVTRVVPHPARDVARIEFLLPQEAPAVSLAVYDVAGRLLARRQSGRLRAGWQSFSWDTRHADAIPRAGVYFYRIEAQGLRGTGTIVVR